MNRIVRENYPVADLPENLREGLALDDIARVVVEVRKSVRPQVPTLKELFAMRGPPYRSMEEIVAEIRRDRDEWDD